MRLMLNQCCKPGRTAGEDSDMESQRHKDTLGTRVRILVEHLPVHASNFATAVPDIGRTYSTTGVVIAAMDSRVVSLRRYATVDVAKVVGTYSNAYVIQRVFSRNLTSRCRKDGQNPSFCSYVEPELSAQLKLDVIVPLA